MKLDPRALYHFRAVTVAVDGPRHGGKTDRAVRMFRLFEDSLLIVADEPERVRVIDKYKIQGAGQKRVIAISPEFAEKVRGLHAPTVIVDAQLELGLPSVWWKRVLIERERQDVLWGGPAHDDTHTRADWSELLSVHVGKLISAGGPVAVKDRLVAIAALAIAAVESIDRQDFARVQEALSVGQPAAGADPVVPPPSSVAPGTEPAKKPTAKRRKRRRRKATKKASGAPPVNAPNRTEGSDPS